ERRILELWIERIRRELGVRRRDALRERPQRPVLREVALADHVELVIEDEEILRRAVRRERLAFEERVAADLEVRPEDLVHRQESSGHPAGGRHELPATHPELFGGGVGDLLRASLDALLLLGL